MGGSVELEWHRFAKLTDARRRFAKISCIYVQTDPRACPIRIGKATRRLEARYRGGTGYAIDAAMHGSGNLVFVASADKELCGCIEAELIWQGRSCLPYNNHGKILPPSRRMTLSHLGTPPVWSDFEVTEAATSR